MPFSLYFRNSNLFLTDFAIFWNLLLESNNEFFQKGALLNNYQFSREYFTKNIQTFQELIIIIRLFKMKKYRS